MITIICLVRTKAWTTFLSPDSESGAKFSNILQMIEGDLAEVLDIVIKGNMWIQLYISIGDWWEGIIVDSFDTVKLKKIVLHSYLYLHQTGSECCQMSWS